MKRGKRHWRFLEALKNAATISMEKFPKYLLEKDSPMFSS